MSNVITKINYSNILNSFLIGFITFQVINQPFKVIRYVLAVFQWSSFYEGKPDILHVARHRGTDSECGSI